MTAPRGPSPSWRERLELMPGQVLAGCPVAVLGYGPAMEILLLAAGVSAPREHGYLMHLTCERVAVEIPGDVPRYVAQWQRMSPTGAMQVIEDQGLRALLEGYWETLAKISSRHADVTPYYNSMRGDSELWRRTGPQQLPPPHDTFLVPFSPLRWHELGVPVLWLCTDIAIASGSALITHGSWDVELYFPRVNVDRVAESLSGGAATSSPAAASNWHDDLVRVARDALSARSSISISEAMRGMCDLPDVDYDVDEEGNLLLPDGTRISKRTVENELYPLRKRLTPSQ